jgi:hypothetical protein
MQAAAGPAVADRSCDDDRSGSGANIVKTLLRLVAGAAFVAAILPALNWVMGFGAGSAVDYKTYGGSVENGTTLGVDFAIALGALLVIAGYLCLGRVSRTHFVVPSWALGISVVAILGWLLFAQWLIGIGGMGGPQPPLPASQAFGDELFRLYPALAALSVGGIITAQGILRSIDSYVARIVRLSLPPILSSSVVGVILILTRAASDLHQ